MLMLVGVAALVTCTQTGWLLVPTLLEGAMTDPDLLAKVRQHGLSYMVGRWLAMQYGGPLVPIDGWTVKGQPATLSMGACLLN